MEITPIDRKKVSDAVFDQMREMVVRGRWMPGDKLPSENELTLMFNVSRVTIREALKKLASLNIVETRQGSGSFVRALDGTDAFDTAFFSMYTSGTADKTIRDMMEFRGIIEGESVYLATQRATPDDLEQLAAIYRQMIAARGDIKAFAHYDLQFHKYIAQLTKNVVLIKCYAIVWDFVKEYFDQVVEKMGVERGIYYHAEILRAMEAHDAGRARDIMREHLQVTCDSLFSEGL